MRVKADGGSRKITLRLQDGVAIAMQFDSKGECDILDSDWDEIKSRCPGLTKIKEKKVELLQENE